MNPTLLLQPTYMYVPGISLIPSLVPSLYSPAFLRTFVAHSKFYYVQKKAEEKKNKTLV